MMQRNRGENSFFVFLLLLSTHRFPEWFGYNIIYNLNVCDSDTLLH